MMGSDRVFVDGSAENCPDCGGKLQYQTKAAVICLDCDEEFGHYYSVSANGKRKDRLYRAPENEVVARA